MSDIIVDATGRGDYTTIQEASNNASAGDVIRIVAGTYPEMVSVAGSGSEGAYITYEAFGDGEVIIDAEATRSYCIITGSESYLKFKNLKLINASASVWNSGIRISNSGSYIELDGLKVQGNGRGIFVKSDSIDTPITNITITNCEVWESDQHGIYIEGAVHGIVIGPDNHSYKNTLHQIEIQHKAYPDGDYLLGPWDVHIFSNEVGPGIPISSDQGIRVAHALRVLIEDNHCHNLGSTGIQIENDVHEVIVRNNLCEYNSLTSDFECGIWIDDSYNVVVDGNVCRYNARGIAIQGSEQVIIRNNSVYGNKYAGGAGTMNTTGIYVDGASVLQYVDEPNDIAIVHNILYDNGAANNQVAGGIAIGRVYPTKVENIIVRNNIVSEMAGPYDLEVGDLTGPYESNYNNYYHTRALKIKWAGSFNTWSEYLSNSGEDSDSIVSNPNIQLDDPDGNYYINSTSPCFDAGGAIANTSGSGSGTEITLDSVAPLSDGYGLVVGDLIVIGGTKTVRVIEVNYSTDVITVSPSTTWNDGDSVDYSYVGDGPDIGIYRENTMTVITDLQTIENELRQYVLDLTSQADAIAQVIVDLQVLDDQLDQVSDIIDLD